MFRQDREELARVHGGPLIKAGRGLEMLPDGTSVTTAGIRPPPDDPLLRLQAQRKYHRAFLEWAEKDAGQVDAFVKGHGPMPSQWFSEMYGLPEPRTAEEVEKALAHLQAIVGRERQAMEALDREIAAQTISV